MKKDNMDKLLHEIFQGNSNNLKDHINKEVPTEGQVINWINTSLTTKCLPYCMYVSRRFIVAVLIKLITVLFCLIFISICSITLKQKSIKGILNANKRIKYRVTQSYFYKNYSILLSN